MDYYERLIHQDADIVLPPWDVDQIIADLRSQIEALKAANRELQEVIYKSAGRGK